MQAGNFMNGSVKNLTRTLLAAVMLFASASVFAEPRTVGSLEATIKGQPIVFHAIHSDVDANHTAIWMERGAEERVAILGGYESPDIEFADSKVSGEGAMLVISFGYSAGQFKASYRIPSTEGFPVSILMMSRVGDYTSSRMMEQGQLEVSQIEQLADGMTVFKGTFSGSLEDPEGADAGSMITDGRFELKARQISPK